MDSSGTQSSCSLKVSRAGNVGLPVSTAYRPWPCAFRLWRTCAGHWGVLTNIPRDPCPITAQNEPEEHRDWAGHTKVMMEGGWGAGRWKVRGQGYEWLLKLMGQGGAGLPQLSMGPADDCKSILKQPLKGERF